MSEQLLNLKRNGMCSLLRFLNRHFIRITLFREPARHAARKVVLERALAPEIQAKTKISPAEQSVQSCRFLGLGFAEVTSRVVPIAAECRISIFCTKR